MGKPNPFIMGLIFGIFVGVVLWGVLRVMEAPWPGIDPAVATYWGPPR